MRLITAHRILIGSSVVFFLFFALWELRNYFDTNNGWAIFRGLLYLMVSVGFAIYLNNLKRWYK